MDKEKEQERLWNGERKEPREKESMSLTQHWNWSFRKKKRLIKIFTQLKTNFPFCEHLIKAF